MEQNDATPTTPQDAPDLDAAGILATKPHTHRVERHFIPEWKGNIYIKTLTGEERDGFEESLMKEVQSLDDSGGLVTRRVSATENVRAKLLVRAICDKDGNPIFTVEQVAALGALSANGLTRAYNIASKMNAVSESDVKELAKNSGRAATVSG